MLKISKKKIIDLTKTDKKFNVHVIDLTKDRNIIHNTFGTRTRNNNRTNHNRQHNNNEAQITLEMISFGISERNKPWKTNINWKKKQCRYGHKCKYREYKMLCNWNHGIVCHRNHIDGEKCNKLHVRSNLKLVKAKYISHVRKYNKLKGNWDQEGYNQREEGYKEFNRSKRSRW